MKKLILCIIIIAISLNTFSQDSQRSRSSLTIAPFSLFDRNLNLNYYWRIDDNLLVQINPRVRLVPDPPGINAYEKFLFIGAQQYMEMPLPYNRISLRSGIMYKHKGIFYEPKFLYEYGFILNESIWWGTGQDNYTPLNITYHAVGPIITIGTFKTKNWFVYRGYYGLGVHLKRYKYEVLGGITLPSYITNTPIHIYYKFGFSVHLGIELGYNFK